MDYRSVPEMLMFLLILIIVGAVFWIIFNYTRKLLMRYFYLGKWAAIITSAYLVFLVFFYFSVNKSFGCKLMHNNSGVAPDNAVTRLIKSKMASHIPDTMEVGKMETATVKITQSLNDSILLKNEKRDRFEIDSFSVSSRVLVTLTDASGGDNFKIQPLNTEEQIVDKNTSREWKWTVLPLRKGDKNALALKVSTIVKDKLGTGPVDMPVFEKTIYVKTTMVKTIWKFVSENWQWLIVTIFLPLWAWFRGSYLKRTDKPAETEKQVGFLPSPGQKEKKWWKKKKDD
jgi:hypothetical protein